MPSPISPAVWTSMLLIGIRLVMEPAARIKPLETDPRRPDLIRLERRLRQNVYDP